MPDFIDRFRGTTRTFSWSVGAARDLPISDDDTWDGDAAAASIFAWAGFDGGVPDAAKARKGFLIYDGESSDQRKGYKLPFARVSNGKLTASRAGLRAAASRLPQTDAPSDVLDRARAVIEHYQKKMGATSEANDNDADDQPRQMSRIRLAIVSEVRLDDAGNARPVHMLRVGTFADSLGRKVTFTPEHLRSIVANYAKRPNPPITESHDFGPAIGRTAQVWTDPECQNLYGLPRWNSKGQQLLHDEVYDGYSCELEPDDQGGYVKIGGSLTNYPAVSGLAPVRLSAPALSIQQPQQEQVMPENENGAPQNAAPPTNGTPPAQSAPAAENPIAPDLAALITQLASQSSARSSEQLTAMLQAQIEQQFALATQQAEAAAARKIMEFQAQQQITAFAQDLTTPTLKRQHALPLDTQRVVTFLSGLSAESRKEAQALFTQVLDSGLLSFEEFGSAGAGQDDNPIQQYEDALAQALKVNPVRSVAISNLQKQRPDLVAAYNAAMSKKGGR